MSEIPQSPPLEQKPECYVPKMKPGDVEIPNRVFVKGFPKDAVVDDLFTFFETYGKVLECRIVADRYGCSKGFGFVTFDSQNVAETVKELERIKYTDDIELVIGPARIRKKRYYLLPANAYAQPQPYYASDGSIVWATPVPPQPQVPSQPQMMGAVAMNATAQPSQATNYGQPVFVSVVNDPQFKQQQQQPQQTQQSPQPQQQQCFTYQTASPYQPNSPVMDQKMAVQTSMASQVCIDDSQQVPCMSPVSTGYVDVQQPYMSDGIMYSPMVPMIPKMQAMHIQ